MKTENEELIERVIAQADHDGHDANRAPFCCIEFAAFLAAKYERYADAPVATVERREGKR